MDFDDVNWKCPILYDTYNVLYLLTSYSDWNLQTLSKSCLVICWIFTLFSPLKCWHLIKERGLNLIRIGCLEKITVTVTGSWRWEESGIFFPKNKLPRAVLSCEIREEPLPFISVRRWSDRPVVFPWLHRANVGSRGHSSLWNAHP